MGTLTSIPAHGLTNSHYDVVVIGGGINGTGIAADMAGRGLSVALFEADDLGCATSSASSKLLHGGLRYLEHYEFRLVREALAEREILLARAPYLARGLRFRLPYRAQLRPAWLIRIGLFIYDHLAKRISLPASHGIRFSPEDGLRADVIRGFEYSDAWVDDARLVVLNALAAQERGAHIATRTACTRAIRHGDHWQLELMSQPGGQARTVTCTALVNATGPWVQNWFETALQAPSPRRIRLIKGSHIVVPRLHPGPEAYLLQHTDRRVVFVIPFLEHYSLIGTTDMEYQGDLRQVVISDDEIQYLCQVVNSYFRQPTTPQDVVWSYAGVRPLCDDESTSPQAITRDYTLSLQDRDGKAPLLSVFGGKLTTFRKLAEAASHQLAPYFSAMGPDWSAQQLLPGGDSAPLATLIQEYQHHAPWLDSAQATRIATAYGTRARLWLPQQPVRLLGGCLAQEEVDYLVQHEWARSADDILWRRSKLGLQFPTPARAELVAYLAARSQEAS